VIIYWVLILLIVVAWSRLIFLLLRLFSFKLSIPLRSPKKEKGLTKVFAGIAVIALLAYFYFYRDSLSITIELLLVLILPFIFEEWILPMFTRDRAYLSTQKMYTTANGIEVHDLSEIYAVKIEQDHIRVISHQSSFAFLVFKRLDYSVNDWETLEDYFHKYHGKVTHDY